MPKPTCFKRFIGELRLDLHQVLPPKNGQQTNKMIQIKRCWPFVLSSRKKNNVTRMKATNALT